MTENETTTAGTEGQDGGKGLESAAQPGTPAPDNRNAESGDDVENLKKLVASLQEKAGKVNALEAELSELKASAPAPAVREDEDEETQLLRVNQELAARGDAAAKLALLNYERGVRSNAVEQQFRDLALPPSEEKRLRAHINANRGAFGNVRVALNDMRAAERDSDLERLRKENEALKRGPDPDVAKAPPTQGREYSARETKAREMTYDEWKAHVARVEESEGPLAAMKLKGQLQGPSNPKGTIKLR